MKKLTVLFFVFLMTAPAFASGDLENQFYFRFGLSKPTKSYFGVEEESFWDDTKRQGYVFELGSIFMLNSIDITDGMRIGVNADYAEFTYHQFKYDNPTWGATTGIFSIASKVGPSFSYSPVDGLVFDAFVKAKISWLTGMATVNDNSSVDDESYGGGIALGYATGINVRYKFLMLSFEFDKVRKKLKDVDDTSNYFGELNNSGDDKTSMPHMNITFGFSF